MFNGAVTVVARIRGNGLEFSPFTFDPKEPGVVKIELDGSDGHELRATVYLAGVASQQAGRAIASKAMSAALDRVAFHYLASVDNARITGDSFTPAEPVPGQPAVAVGDDVCVNCTGDVTRAVDSDGVRSRLEQAAPPGECHYALMRSARQSASPIEEFMHLYNILLMLHNDRQSDVDNVWATVTAVMRNG
jgi:hypothetical protein